MHAYNPRTWVAKIGGRRIVIKSRPASLCKTEYQNNKNKQNNKKPQHTHANTHTHACTHVYAQVGRTGVHFNYNVTEVKVG